jgi:hypothetical protein
MTNKQYSILLEKSLIRIKKQQKNIDNSAQNFVVFCIIFTIILICL